MNRVGFCLGFVVLTLVATVEVYGLPEFVYLNRGWSSIDCRESDDPLTASYGGVDECFTGSASISAYVCFYSRVFFETVLGLTLSLACRVTMIGIFG